MNNVMLVGRLAKDPELRNTENGKEVSRITVAINRSFKNPNGVYETDFIDCVLWEGLARNLSEYCKKGDTVGIRGRLQVSQYEKDDTKHYRLDVIAEKITFLSSASPKDSLEIDGTKKESKPKKDK